MTRLELSTDADQLAASLRAAGQLVDDLEPVNRRAGEVVGATPAPRRSGQLGASVRADATATGVTVAGHTPYWTFVHWGAPRRHVIAQPWLLAGLRANESQIVELYATHLAGVVDTIGE